MTDKLVVLGIFPDEGLANSAVEVLKEWDKAEKSIKLDAMGVLVADAYGELKTQSVGRGTLGKGAGLGLALAMLTPVGLVAGVVGGGLVGALHKKGLGLKPEVREQLGWDLSDGSAAVGVLVAAEMTGAVEAKLTELGATIKSLELSDEALAEAQAAAESMVFEVGDGTSPTGSTPRRQATPPA
jgi:uncharacterized membrane protein